MFPITQADYRSYAAILGLSPRDDMQRDLKARALALAVDLQHPRTLLLAQRVPSILKPLLIAMICWLVVIFLGFGLLAPTNATTTVALIAAAVSITSAVFLIIGARPAPEWLDENSRRANIKRLKAIHRINNKK